MKKVLIFVFLCTLFGCKKTDQSIKPTSIYEGVWVRTKLVDTLYNHGLYFGSNFFDVSLNKNTLNFAANGTGTSTEGNFNYSVSTLSLTFASRPTVSWEILNKGNGSMVLIAKNADNSEVVYDYYSK